jgi:type I restriction enzyme S subunit
MAEQKAIAHILGTLDDKIDLNRRMNQTLEAMAQTLFKECFIEPIQDGLPDGWRDAELSEIATVTSGKRPPPRYDHRSPNSPVPLYGGGGPMGFVPSPLFEQPLLLTGRVGTLGLIFRTAEPSWPSDNTLVIEPQEDFFDFTYFALKRLDLTTLNRGSSQPLLTQSDLKCQKLFLPPPTVIKAFARISQPIFSQINANTRESSTLAQLRDTLLPKLLSGEVRIKDAERFLDHC